MKARIFVGFAAIFLLTVVAWNAPHENTTATAAQSITLPELRDHMFYLASDELAGRQPGTQGYRDAVMYAVIQLRASGLQPVVKIEDGELSYMQPFTMKKIYKSANNSITVKHAGESASLVHGTDYAMLSMGKNGNATKGSFAKIEGKGVAYVGYGISEPDAGWDDYEGLDVKGLVVIMHAGAPMKGDGEPALPEKIHNKYKDAQRSIMPKLMAIMAKGAAGVIIAPSDIGGEMNWNSIISIFTRPTMTVVGGAGRMDPFAMMQVPFFLASDNAINKILAKAPYNPVNEGGEYSTFIVEGLTLDMVMEVTEEEFTTNNVVAMVEGTDPTLKNEYITIGAHLDHEGIIGGQVYNGADDNASGSVAVLEAAEAVAMAPPRRSVIFILYSAEESGLHGSRWFVNNSPVPVENIVLNINMDMVGRETAEAPGGIQVIGSKRRSTELKQIVIEANERVGGLVLDFGTDENDPQNYFGRSDHFNFHQKGIPAVFFSSGSHEDYTQPSDDPEKIDFEKLAKVAHLCFEVAQAIGNRDARLVQDAEAK